SVTESRKEMGRSCRSLPWLSGLRRKGSGELWWESRTPSCPRARQDDRLWSLGKGKRLPTAGRLAAEAPRAPFRKRIACGSAQVNNAPQVSNSKGVVR